MEELKTASPAGRSRTPGKAVVSARLRELSNDARHVYRLTEVTVRRTIAAVLKHDCLNLAQSCAYSAIVALFPALIVAAAVVGLLPDTMPLRLQVASFFDRVLPPDVSPVLDAYFENAPRHLQSMQALGGAVVVSVLGASNVVVTLMEGLRRARQLPESCWSFWERRRRALALVPLSMLPLAVASLLVMFGHSAVMTIAANLGAYERPWFFGLAAIVRWAVALSVSVGLIALVYHLGTPERNLGVGRHAVYVEEGGQLQSILVPNAWFPVLPGALVATLMWFFTTLGFGWYVTRFANYSEVYGSLGAGIALLFWLYIISLSVLCGAEFNAQFHLHFAPRASDSASEEPGGRVRQ